MWKSLNLRGFCKIFNKNKPPAENTSNSDQKASVLPVVVNKTCLLRSQISSFGRFDYDQKHNKDHDNEHQNDSNQENGRVRPLPISFLETISWMGTALAISLHFKLVSKGKYYPSDVQKGNYYYCSHHDQFWKGINQLLWKYAYAMPSIPTIGAKLALPSSSEINNQKSKLVQKHQNDASLKLQAKTTELKETKTPISAFDKVEASAKELEYVTVEYFSHLETVAGLYAVNQNPKKGFEHFQNGGKLGNPKAHFNLGVCYETGLGTKINLVKAAEHYKIASHTGHNLATYNLGVFYLEGRGDLIKDTITGVRLIETAADKGVTEAQTFMGIHYAQSGLWSLAVPLLEKASLKDPEAQYYLSVCYKNGLGVPVDSIRAQKYFNKAAMAGYTSEDETDVLNTLNKSPEFDSNNSEELLKGIHISSTPNKSTIPAFQLGISTYLDEVFSVFQKDENEIEQADKFWLENKDKVIF